MQGVVLSETNKKQKSQVMISWQTLLNPSTFDKKASSLLKNLDKYQFERNICFFFAKKSIKSLKFNII